MAVTCFTEGIYDRFGAACPAMDCWLNLKGIENTFQERQENTALRNFSRRGDWEKEGDSDGVEDCILEQKEPPKYSRFVNTIK